MKIYVVVEGTPCDNRIDMEGIVGFTTRREAEAVVNARKKADAYAHQYDTVEVLHVYRTRRQWTNGVRQRELAQQRKTPGQ